MTDRARRPSTTRRAATSAIALAPSPAAVPSPAPPPLLLAGGTPPPPSEQAFMQAIRIEITRQLPELRLWRQPTGRVRTDRSTFIDCAPVGAADLTGIVQPEGWRVEIEVKGALTRITPEQITWGTFARRAGAVYALVRYNADLTFDENLAVAIADIRIAIGERRSRA